MSPATATLGAPPSSDYLGTDPVGTRYAALKRAAFTPATLAHHLSKTVAEILPVLRNESEDPRIIREVDAALGILPDQVPDLEDAPEEKPIDDMTTGEIAEELRQGAADLDDDSTLPAPCSPLPASSDPDYLAELAEDLAVAEDETLHLVQEPDYSTERNVLLTKLFDVLRESAGEITLESIDRDMKVPRGTARNVLIGDARHAKVEDFLCWLTDMQRDQCWPPDGETLHAPWPRVGRRNRPAHAPALPAPRALLPAFSTPKGPRT